MRAFEINCVARAPGLVGHDAITHIGHNGNDWCLTRGSAMERVEAGFEAYYILNRQTGVRAQRPQSSSEARSRPSCESRATSL